MPQIEAMTFRGRHAKLGEAAGILRRYLRGSVLDVGCDRRELARWVQGTYLGVDIAADPDVTLDVERGLPFPERSFDSVVAFDILEHCDRIHFVFDELCRVSRRHVIVGLPNMYEWRFRLLLLSGKELSGKYGLPPEDPPDRHRWFFDLDSARSFVRERGARHGFSVAQEVLGYYGYRRLIPRLITAAGRALAPRCSRLLAYHYTAALERSEGRVGAVS
jgi:SAM-dependent methyltransferase